MGSAGTSADALIEILDLCEQTLTVLCPHDDVPSPSRASDKTSQSRQPMRANVARRLVLIQGGLPSDLQHPNNRWADKLRL
jgi:hypothetical protein